MNEYDNKIRQIILLALLPLLGGTINLVTALIIAISCILMALLIRVFYMILKKYFSDKNSIWFLLLALGLSISYSIYILIPVVLPFTEPYINIYLLLIGVTPLIYAGCRKIKWKTFFANNLIFMLIMILIAGMREILGEGSLLGQSILAVEPLTLISGPIGAFVVVGTAGILLEIIYNRGISK